MTRTRLSQCAAVLALAGILGLSACSSGSPKTTAAQQPGAPGGPSGGRVLPVTVDPITNAATAQTLHIASVLVENNIDDRGKPADDHLEITVSNSGTTDLTGVEVFYTIADSTARKSESYYTKLPNGFTIPTGGTRTIHFDGTGAVDHFPVNPYSLYYTSTNALEITVKVSAQGAAIQTATAKKDAGGAEAPD